MKRVFLVIGTPRSGTSLVAGILHNLGVHMGLRIPDPKEPDRWDFGGANEWNPKGFFQCGPLVNLMAGCYGDDFSEHTNDPLTDEQRIALRRYVLRRESESGDSHWGAKDPRLVFCLDEFKESCDSPVMVIVTERSLSQSIDSWAARSEQTREESERKIRMFADAISGVTPDMTIRFDDVASPDVAVRESVVNDLCELVQCKPTMAALEFADHELRRFHA